jgi:hypothetical protein
MQYPAEFSGEARAAVEAALIRSRRRHEDRKRQWRSDWPFPDEESVRTCILEAFLVYAGEAIELGRSGVWTTDRVRLEAVEGLRCLTIEIGSKTDYQYFIERNGGSITAEARRTFEATNEWRQFEDGLLALAESRQAYTQAFEVPGPRADAVADLVTTRCRDIETPKEPRPSEPNLNVQLIEEWLKKEGYTNEELANTLNISQRTVSSIRNNGRYHGADAVTKLANLMGRDPDDLYLREAST